MVTFNYDSLSLCIIDWWPRSRSIHTISHDAVFFQAGICASKIIFCLFLSSVFILSQKKRCGCCI